MIDPNKVTEAVSEFLKNPQWKKIFMNAPSGAMERLAISFYFSKFHDSFQPEDFQEYRELRDEYEKSMTEEDLQYLIDNSDKDTAIKHYQELLDKINSGQQPTGTLRFEKEEGNEETDGGEDNTETSEAVSDTQEEPQQEEGTKTPTEKEKPSEGQESAPEAKSDNESGNEDSESGEEKAKSDGNYDTALSVTLNYLNDEKKKQ